LMEKNNAKIPLPTDVIVSDKFAADAVATTKKVNSVKDNEMILDVGPEFTRSITQIIKSAGTVIWNGPLGVFEIEQFSHGTHQLAKAIGKSHAFSLAGGGDTIAAINKFELAGQMSYISTAGGALLEFLEGKVLPAVVMLQKNKQKKV